MQIVQLIGATFILLAFAAVQTGRLRPEGFAPTLLNLVGALMLAASAYAGDQWGFLMLNSAWAAIAAWGLFRKAVLPRRSSRHSRSPRQS